MSSPRIPRPPTVATPASTPEHTLTVKTRRSCRKCGEVLTLRRLVKITDDDDGYFCKDCVLTFLDAI